MTMDYQLCQQQQYQDYNWFSFLLIQSIFTSPKKQKKKKCNVNEENKKFSADGTENNGVVDFLLFV